MVTHCVVYVLDSPFEVSVLHFDVTHRGGTYVSAVMNVSISVPRGAIRRNESITLSCQYFRGDKEKLGMDPSANIVSSVYELSPSAGQSVFMKRVQITLPQGVVLQCLGQKFQLKAIFGQKNEDESEILCWKPIPSKFCAFASGFAVLRVNHFSLLAVIIETVQAGVEFIQRALQTSNRATEESVSSDSEVVIDNKANKQFRLGTLPFGEGVSLKYHAAVFGHTSTETEDDAILQKFYVYCYYGIPEHSKVAIELFLIRDSISFVPDYLLNR